MHKIIQINVNSLRSHHKRHALEELLKTHRPDIVLLSETKLESKHTVAFRDYNITVRRGGGTGILTIYKVSILINKY